jgi:hypothetical protein
MNVNNQFDPELSNALLGFNGEAVLYCQGISDIVAQEYAQDYARMLANRAKGMEFALPRSPYGLFEPSRNLIKSTLDRMSDKYFRSK